MKTYSHFGINDFIVCLGYKGYLIKEYFSNYFLHMSDVTFDIAQNRMEVHDNKAEPWRVTLVDTGENTMTGGRIKRIARYVGTEDFCLTYGDGVGDIDIPGLLAVHREQKRFATVTATRPPGRFGALQLAGEGESGPVQSFAEKPSGDGGYINGGFFVLSPRVFDFIEGDACIWEQEPMRKLVAAGQLAAFVHEGFWQPMDTLRERQLLETLWASGRAPWKVW
jgi:glucose-1-phosphate cytidylyltransferase